MREHDEDSSLSDWADPVYCVCKSFCLCFFVAQIRDFDDKTERKRMTKVREIGVRDRCILMWRISSLDWRLIEN